MVDEELEDDPKDELKPGHTLMQGQYTIDSFLNAGGFGITYLARNSLNRKVVIKECFPGAFCRRSNASVVARSQSHTEEFSAIVRSFVDEAHSLAKVKHPNVVGVHQVFEENKTAYMALDFVEGRDLLDVLRDQEHMPEPAQIEVIFEKVLDAVGHIHKQDMLHRDISPDNVILDAEMEPILIDFGAARQDAGEENRILSELRVIKDGYSPQEFYVAGAEQGPYSDLYALAATFYHVITGRLPVNSQNRVAAAAAGEDDPYIPLAGQAEGYSDTFLRGLDKALATLPKDRFASAENLLKFLNGAMTTSTQHTTNEIATVAAAPVPKTSNKNRARILAAIGLAVPIIGGVYVMLPDSNAPSLGAVASTIEDAPAPVDVAAADPAAATVPVPTDNAAAAPDLSTLLNLAAAATAESETVTPEAEAAQDPATIAALNIENVGNALGLATGDDVAPAPEADVAQDTTAPENIEPTLEAEAVAELPITEAPLIIESFDLPQINSAWTIDMSKVQSDATYAIGDIVLGPAAEIDTVLHQMMQAPEGSSIELSVLDDDTDVAAVIETVPVPVIHRTSFPDGTIFETRMIDGLWTTQVTEAPAGSDLEVNDVLIGDLGRELPFDERTSLPETLVLANTQGIDHLTLAVLRQGNMTATSVLLPR